MSNLALTWAWEQTGLTSSEKFVLIALADRADERHSCFPSYERIAVDVASSRRTVARAISSLEAKGFIVIEARRGKDGKHTSNRYVLTIGDRVPKWHPAPDEPSANLSTTECQSVHHRVPPWHPNPKVNPKKNPKGEGDGERSNLAAATKPETPPAEPDPDPAPARKLAAPTTAAITEPIPGRCEQHAYLEDAPACWGCKRAREQHEATERATEQAARTERAKQARQRREADLAAIAACILCDDTGIRQGPGGIRGQHRCSHNPNVERDWDAAAHAQNETNARGAALVRAALAKATRTGDR